VKQLTDIIEEVQTFIDKLHSFDLFLVGAGNVSYEFTPIDYPSHSKYSKTLAMLLGDAMTDFEASITTEKAAEAKSCLHWINCAYAEGVLDNRERLRGQLKDCAAKRTDLEMRLAEAHDKITNLKNYMKLRGIDPDAADKTFTGRTE
jgi:hypothetical protein